MAKLEPLGFQPLTPVNTLAPVSSLSHIQQTASSLPHIQPAPTLRQSQRSSLLSPLGSKGAHLSSHFVDPEDDRLLKEVLKLQQKRRLRTDGVRLFSRQPTSVESTPGLYPSSIAYDSIQRYSEQRACLDRNRALVHALETCMASQSPLNVEVHTPPAHLAQLELWEKWLSAQRRLVLLYPEAQQLPLTALDMLPVVMRTHTALREGLASGVSTSLQKLSSTLRGDRRPDLAGLQQIRMIAEVACIAKAYASRLRLRVLCRDVPLSKPNAPLNTLKQGDTFASATAMQDVFVSMSSFTPLQSMNSLRSALHAATTELQSLRILSRPTPRPLLSVGLGEPNHMKPPSPRGLAPKTPLDALAFGDNDTVNGGPRASTSLPIYARTVHTNLVLLQVPMLVAVPNDPTNDPTSTPDWMGVLERLVRWQGGEMAGDDRWTNSVGIPFEWAFGRLQHQINQQKLRIPPDFYQQQQQQQQQQQRGGNGQKVATSPKSKGNSSSSDPWTPIVLPAQSGMMARSVALKYTTGYVYAVVELMDSLIARESGVELCRMDLQGAARIGKFLLKHYEGLRSKFVADEKNSNISENLIVHSDLSVLLLKLDARVAKLNEDQRVREWDTPGEMSFAAYVRRLRLVQAEIYESTLDSSDAWLSTHWDTMITDRNTFVIAKLPVGGPASSYMKSITESYLNSVGETCTCLESSSSKYLFTGILDAVVFSLLEFFLLNGFKFNRQGAQLLRSDFAFLRSWLEEKKNSVGIVGPESMQAFKRVDMVINVLLNPVEYSQNGCAELPDVKQWLALVSNKHKKKYKAPSK